MIKYIISMLILALYFSLSAIDFVPGPGGPAGGTRTQADLQYHTGADDHHWFGTNRWAVFFDIGGLYPGFEQLQFAASEVVVYFPSSIANDAATVHLYADNADHQPGDELASATLNGDLLGWQVFSLSQDVVGDSLWLVLDYPASEQERWVSGSLGSGEHSWWWDPDYGDNGWWRNLETNGYGSEFLLGLNGQFDFGEGNVDVQLLGLDLGGHHAPGGGFYPAFTLRNNTDEPVAGLGLEVLLHFPDTNSEDDREYVNDPISLSARQTLTSSTSFNIRIPSTPTQMLLSAAITGEDSTGLASNNSIETRFDTFTDTVQTILVENALQSDWADIHEWWSAQQPQLSGDSLYVLNLFPSESDSLCFRTASAWRYLHHQLMGYPAAVVQNQQKILGYRGASQLADSLAACLPRATDYSFFKVTHLSAYTWDSANIQVRLTFANTGAHVFSSYMSDLRFHAVIAQRGVSLPGGDVFGAVMLSRLTDAAGMAVDSLGFGSSKVFRVNYSPNAIPIVGANADLEDLDLVYWFEHEDTGRIMQAGHITLAQIDGVVVSVHEETRPEPMIHISPNPFRAGRPMQVSVGDGRTLSPPIDYMQLDIFNVRGQRVRTVRALGTSEIAWDGRDEHNTLCATGVYLIRITIYSDGYRMQGVRRIVLVK